MRSEDYEVQRNHFVMRGVTAPVTRQINDQALYRHRDTLNRCLARSIAERSEEAALLGRRRRYVQDSSTIHLTILRTGSIASWGSAKLALVACPRDTSRCAPFNGNRSRIVRFSDSG
jgi:hypothetical protein